MLPLLNVYLRNVKIWQSSTVLLIERKELCRALKENDFEQNLIVNLFPILSLILVIQPLLSMLPHSVCDKMIHHRLIFHNFQALLLFMTWSTILQLQIYLDRQLKWNTHGRMIGMLVGQAARSLEIWTGREVSVIQ